ncbi:universal stress protein [Novosphingobium sp. G106]|uniref:universal stress protein n=1 Tax=Novosphingobium sp. G106 TaxID=2849500 RepID=UPI001C2D71F2|nr:universal stress protein [Novosphingobium sp. G106]MBV1692109.1 universal stress protein [Novosphingobium sp. G106]
MYKHLLIATDDSDVGEKGVEHGLSLAKALGARATIITVTEPFPITGGEFALVPGEALLGSYEASQRERATATLTAVKASADRVGIAVETLHVADAQPAEAILATAKSLNCDLIIMGSHGRRGLGRLILGSKTYEVVSHGHIPVLVVR